MIRKTTLLMLAIYTLAFFIPVANAHPHGEDHAKPKFVSLAPLTSVTPFTADRIENPVKPVVFTHGDISWLPELAAQAGWEPKHFKKLGQIILRESGGCPNRKGGDVVDKDCNFIRVSEWNHRSDTGLLQINGINYDMSRNKWAAVCRDLNICTQEPLLDAVTNLRAGKLLYDLAGWEPWNVCSWNPTAKGCK